MSLISQTKLCDFWINFALHTQTPKHSSISNHSVPPFKQRHVFDLGAISPWSKTFWSFHLSRAWTRNAVWKQVFWLFDVSLRWSSRFGNMKQSWPHSGDPQHSRRPLPPPFWWSSQVPKIHTAVLNKTSDTLTPWLMVGQKELPWGRKGLGLTAPTQVNKQVSVKLAVETRKRLNCYSRWGWELSCRMWYWIWLILQENQIFITQQCTLDEQESVLFA